MKTIHKSVETKTIFHNWRVRLAAAIFAAVLGGSIALTTTPAAAGPVVIDGTDANDVGHGSSSGGVNLTGWLYMQRVLESLASQVGNGNKIVVDLGTVSGSQARNAINSAFGLSSLPGAGWTLVHFTTAADITSFLAGGTVSGVSLATAGIIYIPTYGNTTGDLANIAGAMAAVNSGAGAIAAFVGGCGGGGLFAMGENGGGSYGWLSTLIPGITVVAGGSASPINLTAAGIAAFPALPNSAVQAAIPWHDDFAGNFGSLQVLATSDRGGVQRPVILGGGACSGISEISVTPTTATNEVGTAHTVCASVITVTNGVTNFVVGATVTFTVTSGPNAGVSGASVTDSNAVACFTYLGTGGIGIDTINVVYTDPSGINHFGTASKIWVQPSNLPPVAKCKDVTVSADANCQGAASVDDGSFDPDAGDTITIVQTPSGPYALGTTAVTLIVTDSHGASASCTATVTVVDNTPPTVNCPANIVVCNDPGQCSAVVDYVASATDNCGLASLDTSLPSGSVFPKGTTTVTVTAVDTANNTNTCTFTVTVNDCEAPQVACRQAENPSGKKIPVAGKNPRSGQNPDGFYQVLAKDNCDPTASLQIYVKDSAEGPCGGAFAAGPYAVGTIVKLTQSPGHAGVQPMAGVVAAHVHTRGEPVLVVTDSSGNTGCQRCFVPPPPK